MLTSSDIAQIKDQGISLEAIHQQVERLKNGIKYVNLANCASLGNGIEKVSSVDIEGYLARYESFQGSVSKFVPASGAATRMFKHLFEFIETHEGSEEKALFEDDSPVFSFFKRIDSFPFFNKLKESFLKQYSISIEEAILKKEYVDVIRALVSVEGLNYGLLPKGLIQFHKYENETRTASTEQIIEGMHYAAPKGRLNIHFTVSEGHEKLFRTQFDGLGNEVEISYSTQKPSTDTISIDKSGLLIRDNDGKLLFRPSGHGALLENLNNIDDDIVFIKNIDNVVHESLNSDTILYKKLLAGVLLSYQQKVFELFAKKGARRRHS